jgi:4-diphosphocytidyl-2C-methyl-D-erythritol kinase
MLPESPLFAPAKINLGLRVTGRYANGYHRLESVFVPISIFDRLYLQRATTDSVSYLWPAGTTARSRSALALGTRKNPLLLRALALARDFLGKQKAVDFPPLRITVEKNIPSPAGLGGASADAAVLIAGILRRYTFTFTDDVATAAERLGADIPFFLKHGLSGRAALLKGTGAALTTMQMASLRGIACVPDFGFPTAEMFAAMRKRDLPALGAESIEPVAGTESNLALRLNEIPYSDEPISGVRVAQNDFDAAAESVFPDKSRRLFGAKKNHRPGGGAVFPGRMGDRHDRFRCGAFLCYGNGNPDAAASASSDSAQGAVRQWLAGNAV